MIELNSYSTNKAQKLAQFLKLKLEAVHLNLYSQRQVV